MKITLKKPWAERPAGATVIVSDERAWALIEAGIAEAPEWAKPTKAKKEPKAEAKDEKK